VAVYLCLVVLGVVAKEITRLARLSVIAEYQHRLKIVPHFMPEMPEHRPVWFIELGTHPFSIGVVAFGQIDGDHTVSMTDHHIFLDTGQQVESKSPVGVFCARDDRQAQSIELSNEMTLGPLSRNELR